MLTHRLKALIGMCMLVMIALTSSLSAHAQATTAFTYQGYLEAAGTPVNAECDFTVELFDSFTAGTSFGALPVPNVQVTNGVFTLAIDYGGSVFDGTPRYLGVSVQCPGDPGEITLTPRQELTPNPYSIRAYDADNADTANSAPWSGLTDVPAGFADNIDNGITYARTIIVSPVGTPLENGTALRTALDGITGNSPNNPYLIHIEPGIYDVGEATLSMKDSVDIQGSGEGRTHIGGGATGVNALISTAYDIEIRFLTLERTSIVSTPVFGIQVFSGTLSLLHVTMRVNSTFNTIARAIQVDGGSLRANHVNILVDAGDVSIGVRTSNFASSIILSNTTVNATSLRAFGFSVEANAPTTIYTSRLTGGITVIRDVQIFDSQIEGTMQTISSGTLQVAGSQITETVFGNPTARQCVDTYDENFLPLSSTCN